MDKLDPIVVKPEEPTVVAKLLRSRKVWVAVLSIMGSLVIKLGLPTDIADQLLTLIAVVVGVLIGGIALEDGLTNAGQGVPRNVIDPGGEQRGNPPEL